ncbi:hypothetical protein SISNIDRAFT_468182 [Sistotremastrum niveocremeum HHB9708]|uniref:Uncharacterized protein n=1 Tax=Sistotremastrum niveocremeum HHB9708 TaxID=1314777 RepID=A0A164RWE5_9AGAM|nr:hypothetical protein SISNIDRAFT_468182 [Sistotremastrum niveocremeum HHB9708]
MSANAETSPQLRHHDTSGFHNVSSGGTSASVQISPKIPEEHIRNLQGPNGVAWLKRYMQLLSDDIKHSRNWKCFVCGNPSRDAWMSSMPRVGPWREKRITRFSLRLASNDNLDRLLDHVPNVRRTRLPPRTLESFHATSASSRGIAEPSVKQKIGLVINW